MKIIVTRDDGIEFDITEGVQVAYDIAYGSMDWGSGFLDLEQMEAVAALAEACDFPSYSDALDSVAAARKEQEELQERRDREAQKRREQEERMEMMAVNTPQKMRFEDILRTLRRIE